MATTAKASKRKRKSANKVGKTAVKCSLCGKSFGTAGGLAQHIEIAHSNGGGSKSKGSRPKGASSQQDMARMEGGRNNLLADQLDHKVLGRTQDGRSWAMRCLHPCGEEGGGTFGVPDTTNFQVALPGLRCQYVITAPTQITAGQVWDCVILVPDQPEFALVVYTKLSGQSWDAVRTNLNSATPTYSPPVIVPYSLFNATGIARDATKWRTTHRGATFHLNASYIANQGMVYGDNIPIEYISLSEPAVTTPAPKPLLDVAVARVPLMDPNSMTERSERLYVNNAREGCYVVMYPDDATGAMRYLDIGDIGSGTDAGTGAGIVENVQYMYPDQFNVLNGETFRDEAAYAPLRGPVGKIAMGGFSVGIVVFEGIADSASIQCKTKSGLELVPTNASLLQAFVGRSPLLDREALDNVARVAQRAAGAYPASYNDFSTILGSVWNAVKGIAGPLQGIGDFLGGAGIPVVSDIAKVASSLLAEITR